jgi:hypothetical protein
MVEGGEMDRKGYRAGSTRTQNSAAEEAQISDRGKISVVCE